MAAVHRAVAPAHDYEGQTIRAQPRARRRDG
jgi:hypothetical protein